MKDKEKQNKVNEYFSNILIENCKKIVEQADKEIEEMAKIMCGNDCEECAKESAEFYKQTIEEARNNPCLLKNCAKTLYYAGYRKLPEDSVVLTKEEFDKLGLVVETVQEYESDEKGQPILVKERKIVKKLRTDFTELLNQEIRELQLAQERKETAEKILNELYVQFSADYLVGLRNEYKDWKYADLIKRYAKQFGVEIKD